jgi:ABC-type transport system substrate-binding protein
MKRRAVCLLASGLLFAAWLGLAFGASMHLAGPAQAAADEPDSSASKAKKPAIEDEEEPPLDATPKTSSKSSKKAGPAKAAMEDEEEPPLGSPAKGAPKSAKKAPAPAKAMEDKEEPPLRSTSKSSAGKEPGADAMPDDSEAGDAAEADSGEPVCDIVYWVDKSGEVRSFRAALYPDWLQLPLPANKKYTFRFYAGSKAASPSQTLSGHQIRRIDYYEPRMLHLAAARAALPYERLIQPGEAIDLSMLSATAAERLEALLTSASAEHESAVQQNLRRGTAWMEHAQSPLANALFNVRLGRLDQLLAAQQLDQTQALCEKLYDDLGDASDARRAALRQRFERALLGPAQQALAQGDLAGARRLLGALESHYPREPSAATEKLNKRLEAEAKALLDKAEQAADSDRLRALQLVDAARAAAPELEEIDAFQRRLGLAYAVLECAYPELPESFSPLTATTPAQRHASALLFESLVRWTPDPRLGPHYACQLADGNVTALARGRRFHLPKSPPAKWSDYSDEQPYFCTAADVGWTLKLLRDKSCPGYSATRSRLLAAADPASTGNAFLADIRLARDYWQPMSLMEFPVLPKHCFPAGGSKEEWAAFNASPVGSGPSRLAEHSADRVRFVAHPHYRVAGLPRIREINFHRFSGDETINEIVEGRIHLAYGLTAAQVDKLAQRNKHVQTMRPRSVWFLAPNYRRPGLQNQELRLALAHAIERSAILDGVFRPHGHGGDHAALSGPFPADSWASNRDAPDFAPNRARAFAANALRALGKLPPLTLVYPVSDPNAESACRMIEQQAAKVEIELSPQAVAPGEFADRVLKRHDFDLVYWRQDYRDETFELGPLFDPDPAAQAAGGANFMGVVPDAAMAGFFRELTLHKRFADIREQMFKIHDHVARTAVVIPLWQLDAYVAVDASLAGVSLDPDVLFGDVQHWELKQQ